MTESHVALESSSLITECPMSDLLHILDGRVLLLLLSEAIILVVDPLSQQPFPPHSLLHLKSIPSWAITSSLIPTESTLPTAGPKSRPKAAITQLKHGGDCLSICQPAMPTLISGGSTPANIWPFCSKRPDIQPRNRLNRSCSSTTGV